jgi:hypothetical protein
MRAARLLAGPCTWAAVSAPSPNQHRAILGRQKPLALLACMLLVGTACTGGTKLTTGASAQVPCPQRTARSLVAEVVVGSGEERLRGKMMLAYRRPSWVRGEVYDMIGRLQGSFLLEGNQLTLKVWETGEVVVRSSNWDGWDGLLGLPEGSSTLFGLLPVLIDPWGVAATEDPPPRRAHAIAATGDTIEIKFEGARPTTLTVTGTGSERVVCSFEDGNECVAARRYTVELSQQDVVLWVTVQADGPFPELLPADSLLIK